MGSAEVISQVRELTTPATGDTTFVYGLVVPAMKGDTEPKLITGITQLKKEYTPTGKFDTNTHPALYGAKKYFDAGSGQLWAVRVDTHTGSSGLYVTKADSVVGFTNPILGEGKNAYKGYCFNHNNHIYVSKVDTAFPAFENLESWIEVNCLDIGQIGQNIANHFIWDRVAWWESPRGFAKGATYGFFSGIEDDFNVGTSDVTLEPRDNSSYPLACAVDSDDSNSDFPFFGWFQNNPEDSVSFGYFHEGEDGGYVLDEAVELLASDADGWVCTHSIYNKDPNYLWGLQNCEIRNFNGSFNVLSIYVKQEEVLATGSFRTISEGEQCNAEDLIQVNGVGYYVPSNFIAEFSSNSRPNFRAIENFLRPVGTDFFCIAGQIPSGAGEARHIWGDDWNSWDMLWGRSSLLFFYSKDGGRWGDENTVEIINYDDEPDEIEIPEAFLVKHYYRGVLIDTFLCSLHRDIMDANGNSIYIKDVINSRSEYIRVIVDPDALEKDNNVKPASTYPSGSLNFYGGWDNESVFRFDIFEWSEALYKLQDTDKYPIILMGNGGYHHEDLPLEMSSWVSDRKFGVVSYSLPQEDSPQMLADVVDEKVVSNERFWWEALWTTEYDPDTGRTVTIPPDGLMAYTYAKMIQNVGYYEAPAGWINAVVTTKPIYEYDKGARDYLDNKKINFFKTSKLGTCIFSEMTSLKRPSYLQQKHIVIALYDLIPKVEDALEPFLFSLADVGTYLRMRKAVEPIMELFTANKGCQVDPPPEITCDLTNNTQAMRDAQEAALWIEYTPLNSLKKIKVTFALTNGEVRLADITEV